MAGRKKRNVQRKTRKRTRKSTRKMRGVDTVTSLTARMADPFPQRKWARMRYTDNITLTGPNTNLTSEYIYSLNSLFAPGVTTYTHQPYGFDTMALLYYNYQVYSAYVELEWYDPDHDGVICGYQLAGTSVAGVSAGAIEERPLTKLTTLSNTGNQRYIQRILVNNPQVLGFKPAQYINDTSHTGALVTASPSYQSYIRLCVLSTTAATASNIKLKVSITYKTQFWNRVSLSQST